MLNIVTKRPGVAISEVAFSLGDDGKRRATLDFGGGANQVLSYRLNAALENSETFRDYVNNKTNFIAPSLRLKFSPQTNVDLNAEFGKRRAAFDRGFPLSLNFPVLSVDASRFLGEPEGRFDNTSKAGNIMLHHALSDGTKFRLGIASNNATSTGDYFFPVGTTPLISNAGVVSRRRQETQDTNKDTTLVAEAAGRANWGGVSHKWLVGLERNTSLEDSVISRATVNALLDINNPSYGAIRSPATAPVLSSAVRNRTTALVLQDEVALNSEWRITIGARHEKIKSSFADRVNRITRESAVSATTWRTGVSWLPTPTTVLFGNYSESFSPEVTARGLVDGANPVPSRGEQWEVGLREDFLNNRLQVSAAVFEINRSNVRVAEPAPSVLDKQVGSQRARGVELEISGRPTPQWQVVSSISTLNANIVNDTTALAGKRFNGVPRTTAALWNRYDISQSIALGAGITYVGNRFADPLNTLSLPAYTRWDFAGFGKITPAISWQVNLLNAFNKIHFVNGNTNGNFYAGQPRTLRLALTTRF